MDCPVYAQLVFALFVAQQMFNRLHGVGWAARRKVMNENRVKVVVVCGSTSEGCG